MTTIKDALIRPARIEEVELEGIGKARIQELTRSKRQSFEAWLRPGGELNKERDENRDLKICVLCLIDNNGDLLFDLDDDAFDGFVESLQESAAGPWAEIAYHVLRVNGYIKEESEVDELLEK